MSGWEPIPEDAITIDGMAMMPDRLTQIDGKPYVHCYLHGLIPADHRCGHSPSDHLCGVAADPNQAPDADHDDQCSTHEAWENNLLDRVNAIRSLHVKEELGGGVMGDCKECGLEWPCPTFHFASGWGEIHDCIDARWCSHAGVPITPEGVGYFAPVPTEEG